MGGKLIDNPFARHCTNKTLDTSDEITLECKCDFTINLKGCQDENFYIIAFEILIPLTILIVIMSISFLYYRVKIKGQSVFFPATRERGLIRPRPQDSFHIAVGVFNFSQLLVSICLIKGSFTSVTIAETVVYVPRLLGFACAVLYPISIIYSTPILKQTTYSLRVQWNPNKIFVDALAIYLMLGPLLTIVPLTAIAGKFANKENYYATIIKVQAFVWSSWTIQYFITLSYVYYKLIFMLKGYIDILQRRRSENTDDIDMKLKKLNNASHNLTWIVLAVLLIFFINSLEGMIIGISYNKETFTGRLFFISWYFTVPILTFIGQMIFLYDALKNRKSSQHQNNNNTYDRINNIKSRLEEKPIIMKKHNITDLTSDQSITIFVSTNNDSDKKHPINSISMSAEVKTIILSTTGSSTYETKSDNLNDFIENYYFEGGDEESKDTTTPGARKSWLAKKPIRNAPKKITLTDKNLFYKI